MNEQKVCADCGDFAPHYRTRGKRDRLSGYCKLCMGIRSCHRQMIQRCHNSRHPKYHNYGGRGIRVHPSWHDFQTWRCAMGPKPNGSTIERIDNDGDYEPGNCRWASRLEQAQNKRNNVMLEVGGRAQTMSAWAHERGINVMTLWDRLQVGMSPEEAINKAIDISRRHNPATQEIKDRVLALYESGVERAEIARLIRRSPPTITAWLRKWGVLR